MPGLVPGMTEERSWDRIVPPLVRNDGYSASAFISL